MRIFTLDDLCIDLLDLFIREVGGRQVVVSGIGDDMARYMMTHAEWELIFAH